MRWVLRWVSKWRGTSATYHISGRNLCTDCAVKFLGIQNESPRDKVLTLSPFTIYGK